MGFQNDLLSGLGQYLAGDGPVPTFADSDFTATEYEVASGFATWDAAGAYTAGQTGIVIATVPASPDSVIVLTGYGVSDDPSLSDSVTGVQVITRSAGADPRATDDLADSVFDLLHGAVDLDLVTGVRVVQCLRRSHVSLGQDGNRRWARSDNYYLTVHRPSPQRI